MDALCGLLPEVGQGGDGIEDLHDTHVLVCNRGIDVVQAACETDARESDFHCSSTRGVNETASRHWWQRRWT